MYSYGVFWGTINTRLFLEGPLSEVTLICENGDLHVVDVTTIQSITRMCLFGMGAWSE